MRYKEQALNKVAQLENMMRTLDFLVSRSQPQNEILQYISEVKEKVEELRSILSIEHNDFETYGN
jgi:archaellum component FlaC